MDELSRPEDARPGIKHAKPSSAVSGVVAEASSPWVEVPATFLQGRPAVVLFACFAFVYFFSALLRAITATLAPVFAAELALQSADLGLLAGAYFLGFAATQLPLGKALDHFGPRRTLLAMLSLAVLGCASFAMASGLTALVLARVLIGAGLGACLMAPLTCYRRLFSPAAQLRANSWMLMTGSLGMVASTLPVQWLLPSLGWRGLFWGLAAMLLLSMVLLACHVPRDRDLASAGSMASTKYRHIARHAIFVRMAPLGFFAYGGLIAVQSLWAGPWLTRVSGWTTNEAAQGLFFINLCMLVAFFIWGAVMPRLVRLRVGAASLMTWGLPLSLLLLTVNVWLGDQASAVHWAAWCVASSFVSVSQPAVAAAFAPDQAGKALSAFNLVIFLGVFCVQWGLGIAIDLLGAQGLTAIDAFRWAFAGYGVCCLGAYLWFVWARPEAADNRG